MKTIAIINTTGGVGKTTTAYALCSALAIRGYKTVGVDLDPQMTFTELTNLSHRSENVNLADFLTKDNHSKNIYTQPTKDGFSIVPGSHTLFEIPSDQLALSRVTKTLSEDSSGFDFCVIDTPPISSFIRAALEIADSIIIPTEVSAASLHRLAALAELIETTQLTKHSGLAVDGLLLTKYPYDEITGEQKNALQQIAQQFRSRIYDAVIPEDLAIIEAAFYKKNILTEYPDSLAATGYMAFADDFISRNAK